MTRPRPATKTRCRASATSPTGGSTRSTCRWRTIRARRYAYCSANINLVGGALTAATRTWLPEFFERTVARPLQFGRYHWNLMPNGEGYLGGGAFLRPRDLLKVGQAYLDGGVWHGRRIVDRRLGRRLDRAADRDQPGHHRLHRRGVRQFLRRAAGTARLASLRAERRRTRTIAATPRAAMAARCCSSSPTPISPSSSPPAITARAGSGAAGARISSATAIIPALRR